MTDDWSLRPVVIVARSWHSRGSRCPIGEGVPAEFSRTATAVAQIDGPVTASAVAPRLTSPRPATRAACRCPPRPRPVDTSHPDVVVGTGTPASCTSQAVVDAVAHGGIITFDCGPDPVTIVMTDTAKVVNTSPVVVLDGGGKVTLSGADQRRILYMNTCDPAQIWTTSHCQNQDQPQLTIQGMDFTQGDSTGDMREGRRRWRGVRPRRPRQGDRQHLHRQPL